MPFYFEHNPPVFPDQDPDNPGDQSTTATRMVEENTAAGEDVGVPVAAEDDDDDILTYTLGDTPADGAFDIDQATGQIKTKGDLDEDTTDSYEVTVTATDPAGVSDSITVTITVTGVNEPPDITGEVEDYAENGSGVVATFQTDDPESAGTIILDLSGADGSLFSLSQGGVLTFNDPPNYEMPGDADKDNTYEVTVGAKDADDIRGTEDVEVKVTDVNELGTVTLSAVQPRVGVSLTASVTDIDGPVSGVTWQWSISNTDIEDATSDTYTPAVDDVNDTLTATATYTDPQGPEHTATGDSANLVAADTRNKAPVFDDQDDETDGLQKTEAARTVEENTPAAASVDGGMVTATDPYVRGDLTVDYARRRVTVAGNPVELTDIEYRMLVELSANAGRALTHERLLQRVWGPDKGEDSGPVRNIVKRLRRKLGEDAANPAFIFAVPRVGYRMEQGEARNERRRDDHNHERW